MRRFLAAVAFFSILSTGASLAEGWFMKRVEVPVFCADIIEVRKLLLEMVPGVGLGIDPVRNLLLVHGTDEQIEIIQELLEVGKRTDSTLDITAGQTLGPVETETETETETGNWQSGIVKEYMGHEQVREYECSRVLWLKTARMSEE